MAAVRFTHSGDFKNLEKFLKAMKQRKQYERLEAFAQQGVDALAAATPTRTGATAAAWRYEIQISSSEVRIDWINDNENKGFNIAVGLQYGHGTGTGGYVNGIDYINPAMQPTFEAIAEKVWQEVVNA